MATLEEATLRVNRVDREEVKADVTQAFENSAEAPADLTKDALPEETYGTPDSSLSIPLLTVKPEKGGMVSKAKLCLIIHFY